MNTANATTVDNGQIDRYLAAVRGELADLPDDERDDLLDDLGQHLREVAAEEDGPLEARLGDPVAYAQELRASVGYQSPQRGLSSLREAVRTSWPVAHVQATGRAIVDHPEFEEFRDAAKASRPLWWVLRGYGLVLLLGLVAGDRAYGAFPVPKLAGSVMIGLMVSLVAVAGSVAVGRRTDRSRGSRAMSIALNLLAVVLVLSVASTVRNRDLYPASYAASDPTPEAAFHHGMLTGPDGQMITNVYPFGADGQPLGGVTLYDQLGRPIQIMVEHDEDGLPIVTSYPLSDNGRPVMNAYPQHQTVRPDPDFEDDVRDPDPRERPPIDAPVLGDSATEPEPDPSPSPSDGRPSPSPAAPASSTQPSPPDPTSGS